MTHFRIPVQENSRESNFELGNKIQKINEHPPFCLDSFCCEDQLSLAPTLPTWPRRSTRSTVYTSLLFFLPICQLGDLRHHRMPCAQAVRAFSGIYECMKVCYSNSLYLKTLKTLGAVQQLLQLQPGQPLAGPHHCLTGAFTPPVPQSTVSLPPPCPGPSSLFCTDVELGELVNS